MALSGRAEGRWGKKKADEITVSAPGRRVDLVALIATKARRKGAEHMQIVGCDLHTRYQQIAVLDSETGELIERRLEHANGEARAFYAGLQGPVRVGIEATR